MDQLERCYPPDACSVAEGQHNNHNRLRQKLKILSIKKIRLPKTLSMCFRKTIKLDLLNYLKMLHQSRVKHKHSNWLVLVSINLCKLWRSSGS